MRRAVVSLVLVLAAAACDASGASCRTWVAATCDREWACAPEASRSNSGWQQAYGTTRDACEGLQEASFCGDPQANLCPEGTLDPEALDTCSAALEAQSCPEYLAPNRVPPACERRCR